MERRGIDVSEHNGWIDWEQVRRDGVRFAMVRVGYGANNRDRRATDNLDGALAAGVDVGCYWFSYAYTVDMARREAAALLDRVAPYRGRVAYPLCFDWEYDSDRYARQNGVTPSRTLITDMALAFLEAVRDRGWYAMNYANLDFYLNRFQAERLSVFDLWLADYGDGPAAVPYGIRQTSAQGSVGGVGGPVDLDVAVRDYPAIMRARGLNGFEPPFESNGEEASEMIYETVGDVPAWARPTVEKLLAKGFLKGTESGLDLNETMLRLLVINDRAGLYGA